MKRLAHTQKQKDFLQSRLHDLNYCLEVEERKGATQTGVPVVLRRIARFTVRSEPSIPADEVDRWQFFFERLADQIDDLYARNDIPLKLKQKQAFRYLIQSWDAATGDSPDKRQAWLEKKLAINAYWEEKYPELKRGGTTYFIKQKIKTENKERRRRRKQ